MRDEPGTNHFFSRDRKAVQALQVKYRVYLYNVMVEEEREGKLLLDDGRFININDLDEATYKMREQLFAYYFDELCRCVEAEKI